MVVLPAWMRILLASGLCFAAGGISATYLSSESLAYFNALNRPVFFSMPLSVIFFVLIVTYALMAIASSLMWIHDSRQGDFRGWVPMFFVHLLLNIAWLTTLFGYSMIFVPLVLAFVMATYAFLLTAGAWERSKIAFWLLLVYLAWVLYALGMNIALWVSN